MRKILFKDLNIGHEFCYKGECYFKTGETRALGLGGGKEFTLETEVDI